MYIIKRIGVLSAGKLSAVFGVLFGFVLGLKILLLSFILSSIVSNLVNLMPPGSAGLSAVSSLTSFGYIALVVSPIAFLVIGFIFGIIAAWIYNLIGMSLGGLKLDIEEIEEEKPE